MIPQKGLPKLLRHTRLRQAIIAHTNRTPFNVLPVVAEPQEGDMMQLSWTMITSMPMADYNTIIHRIKQQA